MDFTIVVPTYQRPEELAGCLAALGALDYPREAYEVIVVNDGGARDFAGPDGLPRVRVLHQENRGPGAARNFGARMATGRWLAFTDDDCRPEAGWLGGLRAALLEGEDVMCGGHTVNALTENPYAATSQLIAEAAYRYFNADPRRGRFLASNNLSVGREAFLAAGGFDERFRVASEDRELTARWAARHGRVVWAEGAVVQHRHALRLGGFLRQHYRYGQGAALFHAVRGRFWDDVSFRARAGELLLRPALAQRGAWRILALLALWQVANTAGFVRGWLAGRSAIASPIRR